MIGKGILLAIFSSLLLNICKAELLNGDLLFVEEGKSAFSQAISNATSKGETSYVHVGIIWITANGETRVIEASPEDGVISRSYSDFIEIQKLQAGDREITFKRIIDRETSNMAVVRALTHLGEPYDWYYLPDNGRMYCSELIYEIFLDRNGEHIFQTKPMNFRAEDGSIPFFWQELYDKLGVDVPEGKPGTNPNDLFYDPNLTDVDISPE